jgi:predicted HAD superfamily Cof-like phosphohydrolase
MSVDLFKDIAAMHDKFKVNERVRDLSPEMLSAFLDFRIKFLEEEMTELKIARAEENWSEVVDALVDLLVVGAGTLDAFDVDGVKAWDEVFTANMTKSPGVKASRPNAFGLPDLIKPADFVSPDHSDNVGILTNIVRKII